MAGPFKISKFHEVLQDTADVFVCCASFEDRCKTIPFLIEPESTQTVLICSHEEVLEYSRKNLKELTIHFGEKFKLVNLSLDNPLQTVDNLADNLKQSASSAACNYLVDITTFTKESLLILIKLFQSILKSTDKVNFVYNDAEDYSIGLDLPDKWLSKGIKNVRSVLGYPGISSPIGKLHLIVLSGYEVERAAELIEAYEASVVSIGVGDKEYSIHDSLYEANVAYFSKLCAFRENINVFNFSLTDPQQTKDQLEKQIEKFPDCNVVIAPLNNKISTIGAALVAIKEPNTQLCYAQADYYNYESYSKPGDEFYLFELNKFLCEKL
jgi:hypothetical protein